MQPIRALEPQGDIADNAPSTLLEHGTVSSSTEHLDDTSRLPALAHGELTGKRAWTAECMKAFGRRLQLL